MKTIRLFFFAYLIFYITPLFSQEELGDGFLFSDFEKGTVVFKSGSQSAALLNYSMLNQEMLFLDAEGAIMALANPTEIFVVTIGERRFFPISSRSIFYEEIQAGDGSFFVQYKAIMISEGKASAYGGYSSTSSITSYGSIHSESTGSAYKLNVDEKFRMKNQNAYFLQSGKNYKAFNSPKALAKLFKGQESKIEAFAKEQSINFFKIEDVSKIVEYAYGLTKK